MLVKRDLNYKSIYYDLKDFQCFKGYEFYKLVEFKEVSNVIYEIYINYLTKKVTVTPIDKQTNSEYHFSVVLEIFPNSYEAKKVKRYFHKILNQLKLRRIII